MAQENAEWMNANCFVGDVPDYRPKLGEIVRRNGIAGQVAYAVWVTYANEADTLVSFVGSVYGGPVVMVTGMWQEFVTDAGRFGEFGPEWVRRFFGVAE